MRSLAEVSSLPAINTAILRLLLIYLGIPLAIGVAALAVLILRLAKWKRVPTPEQDERFDKAWLGITSLSVPVVACLFYITWLIQDTRGGVRDAGSLILWFPAAIGSLVVTFFAIGIPLRLAMNLAFKARRRRYLLESIALVVAFAALAWMLYVHWVVPAEG
jgi:hypothetical protein